MLQESKASQKLSTFTNFFLRLIFVAKGFLDDPIPASASNTMFIYRVD